MAYGARLESVLSESSQGFESPILRHYKTNLGVGFAFFKHIHWAPLDSVYDSKTPSALAKFKIFSARLILGGSDPSRTIPPEARKSSKNS